VCFIVAKVASGRAGHAEEEEEKLALEGQARRAPPARHHARHPGHTSSPSSSLDTAVSLPRCAAGRGVALVAAFQCRRLACSACSACLVAPRGGDGVGLW